MKVFSWMDSERTTAIEGLRSPQDFYAVLESPGLLAGMRRPSGNTPWLRLAAAGYSELVCLTDDVPLYDPSPLHLLHAVALQDLYGGLLPEEPEQEAVRIGTAVDAILRVLGDGCGVVVHCAGGTGRTGTVIGAVLCQLGMQTRDVIESLDRIHRLRGTGWPESPWQGEILRHFEGTRRVS